MARRKVAPTQKTRGKAQQGRVAKSKKALPSRKRGAKPVVRVENHLQPLPPSRGRKRVKHGRPARSPSYR